MPMKGSFHYDHTRSSGLNHQEQGRPICDSNKVKVPIEIEVDDNYCKIFTIIV